MKQEDNIVQILKEDGNSTLYALEGAGNGDPAVKIEWNYGEESELGLHNHLDTFAIAIKGWLAKDGDEVEYDAWKESDYGNGIQTRGMIGSPKNCEGWKLITTTDGDVDWQAYEMWADTVCNEYLQPAQKQNKNRGR